MSEAPNHRPRKRKLCQKARPSHSAMQTNSTDETPGMEVLAVLLLEAIRDGAAYGDDVIEKVAGPSGLQGRRKRVIIGILEGLMRNGLVEQFTEERAGEDKRCSRFRLTKSGRAVLGR